MNNQFQFQVSLGRASSQGWGTLQVVWNSKGLLSHMSWEKINALPQSDLPPAPVVESIERIQAYLTEGTPLGDPPWEWIDQSKWTRFQSLVYRAISAIPHGETRTYAWVAARVGSVNASRAVGQALRHNPLPLLLPCHRVVSTVSLGGFMGHSDPNQPEMKLKRELLSLEEFYLNPMFSFVHAFDSTLSGEVA